MDSPRTSSGPLPHEDDYAALDPLVAETIQAAKLAAEAGVFPPWEVWQAWLPEVRAAWALGVVAHRREMTAFAVRLMTDALNGGTLATEAVYESLPPETRAAWLATQALREALRADNHAKS